MSHPENDPEKGVFLVAGCKPWSQRVFDQTLRHYPGDWHFVAEREDLTLELVRSLRPRYVFFLHWSWKVPTEVIDEFECVCFHMTDVPYGRGGSPLQNLILRGHSATKLTALRMTADFDAGPVYDKRHLPLEGAAGDIYERASRLAAEMVRDIIRDQPVPMPQQGEVVLFRRRKPEESLVPNDLPTLRHLYDFIRMLDADTYPRAFLDCGTYRFEFSRATLAPESLQAMVTITKLPERKP